MGSWLRSSHLLKSTQKNPYGSEAEGDEKPKGMNRNGISLSSGMNPISLNAHSEMFWRSSTPLNYIWNERPYFYNIFIFSKNAWT